MRRTINAMDPEKKDQIGMARGWPLNTRVKAIASVGFLGLTVILWMMSGRIWLVWLLLAIPAFLCEEWLAGIVNLDRSRWSTAESGFSVLRIVYGVVSVLLFFAAAYGLTLIADWVF